MVIIWQSIRCTEIAYSILPFLSGYHGFFLYSYAGQRSPCFDTVIGSRSIARDGESSSGALSPLDQQDLGPLALQLLLRDRVEHMRALLDMPGVFDLQHFLTVERLVQLYEEHNVSEEIKLRLQ